MGKKSLLPTDAEKLEVDIERMVDRHGIIRVLEALGLVCEAKGEHLESNWQDASTGANWYQVAESIDKVVADHRHMDPR